MFSSIRMICKTVYNVIRWMASTIKAIVYGFPFITDSFYLATIEKDDYILVKDILKNAKAWVQGDAIRAYEDKFANYIGVRRAYSFIGGRVALSAILEAFDVRPGDEVILPAYTCVVVPNAIKYRKAKPVFVDIELDTLGLDVEQVKKSVSEKTKVIILHHLFGVVSRDFEEILDIAKEKGILVIEDCAHALGTNYKDKKLGTFGDAAFFSTEQSKVISTKIGGMAISKHDFINDKLEQIQNKATFPDRDEIYLLLKELLWAYRKYRSRLSWCIYPWINEYSNKYCILSTTEQEIEGIMPPRYFKRMPNALAAIGIHQLSKIDLFISRRKQEAMNWEKWARNNGYQPLKVIPFSEPTYLRYPVLVEPEMKKNNSWVRKLGIELGVWFISMEHPKKVECNFINASKAIDCCVNLPTLRRGNGEVNKTI